MRHSSACGADAISSAATALPRSSDLDVARGWRVPVTSRRVTRAFQAGTSPLRWRYLPSWVREGAEVGFAPAQELVQHTSHVFASCTPDLFA
jgi:hypothetical protein